MRGDKIDRGDGFYQISGSNQWPSDDPEDSPADILECKLCEYTFSYVLYGNIPMEERPEEMIREQIQAHMLWHIAQSTTLKDKSQWQESNPRNFLTREAFDH